MSSGFVFGVKRFDCVFVVSCGYVFGCVERDIEWYVRSLWCGHLRVVERFDRVYELFCWNDFKCDRFFE